MKRKTKKVLVDAAEIAALRECAEALKGCVRAVGRRDGFCSNDPEAESARAALANLPKP